MAINTQKVVVGGLAAGVVLTALDYLVNGVLLAEQSAEAMNALNPDLAESMESTGVIVVAVIIDFLLAIVVVWTYAAFRPRFGPGPKTAFLAGLQPWIVGSLLYAFMAAVGMYTWSYYVLGSIAMFVILQAAAQLGGKLYSEGGGNPAA